MIATWPFGDLRLRAYRVILIDAPMKFSSGPNRNPNNHFDQQESTRAVSGGAP
jgi:hypothetical protein